MERTLAGRLRCPIQPRLDEEITVGRSTTVPAADPVDSLLGVG